MDKDEAVLVLLELAERFVWTADEFGYVEFGPYNKKSLQKEREAIRVLEGCE